MPTSFKDSFSSVHVIRDALRLRPRHPFFLCFILSLIQIIKVQPPSKDLLELSPMVQYYLFLNCILVLLNIREIIKRCGILDLLEEGDGFMADKGFTIEDLLSPLKCSLNVSPIF